MPHQNRIWHRFRIAALKAWFYGYWKILRLLYAHRQLLLFSSALSLFALLLVLLGFYQEAITGYLLYRLTNEGLLQQLAIGIGTVLGAGSVIVFGLAQFALQQTLEKSTVGTAEAIRRKPLFYLAFISLTIIAFASFALTFIPINKYTVLPIVIFACLFLIESFGLWWAVFSYAAKMANPSTQIRELYFLPSIKHLRKLPLHIERFILFGGVTSKDTTMPAPSKEERQAFVYDNAKEFTQGFEYNLNEIFEITKHFAEQRRLDVVKTGVHYIAILVRQYLAIRLNNFMDFTGMFFTSSIPRTASSRFMEQVYDRLHSVVEIAVSNKDKEMASVIIAEFAEIAYTATAVKPIPKQNVENSVAAMAISFLFDSIKTCIHKGMYDVGLQGSGILGATAAFLVQQKSYLTVLTIQEKLKELGLLGLVHQQWYLTTYALKGLGGILRVATIQEPFIAAQILQPTLQHIQALISVSLPQLETGTLKGRVDISHAYEPIMSGAGETTLVDTFYGLAQKIGANNEELYDQYHHIFYEFSEELSHRFYRDLIPIVRNGSFLLHQIGMNIRSILLIYFELLRGENMADKKKIEGDASWLIYYFQKLYKELTNFTGQEGWGFDDLLATSAMNGIDIKSKEITDAAIHSLAYAAKKILEKDMEAFYRVPRIADKLAYIVLYAGKKGDNDAKKLASDKISALYSEYKKKFREEDDKIGLDFFRGIRNLEEEYYNLLHRIPGINEAQSKVASTLNYNEVRVGVAELRQITNDKDS